MRQKLFLLLALFAATITFGACSSDDDGDKTSADALVGTWYCETDGYGCEFQFTADGTVTYTETMLEDATSRSRDTGTYRLSGSTLSLHWTKSESWSNYRGEWTIDDTDVEDATVRVRVKGKELTLSPVNADDGSPVTFTRK